MSKPSIVARAKEAWRFFQQGYPAGRKASRQVGVHNLQPQWRMADIKSYVREGFNLNSLIYSAIMFKARAVITAPLRAYTGDPNYPELLEGSHPLAKLVTRPNEHQSWAEFQSLNIVFLNIAGDAYVYKDREHGHLRPLRPDRVVIVPTKKDSMGIKTVDYYLYVPKGASHREGYPIIPEDMIQIKFPNPSDPLGGAGYGHPPISSLAQSGDVDNMVTEFLNLFFKRGAMLTSVLSFDTPLTEDLADTISARWEQKYGGHKKWGTGILDRGGTYNRVGLTFEEMGFSELDARNECRILGPFGVPPILIGSRTGLEHSTYCLPWYTKISTPQGPVNIKDLEVDDQVWSFIDNHLELRKVTWSGKVGRKRLYEIKTKNNTLYASGNHPILVLEKGDCRVLANEDRAPFTSWKRADALEVGDKVIQPKYYPDLERNTLPGKSEIDPRFLQFAGAILGDGTVSYRRVAMAIPPGSPCHDHYVQLAKRLFAKRAYSGPWAPYGTVPRAPITIGTSRSSFHFTSTADAGVLRELGFGGRAHTKRIPGWVFGLNKELRLSLLAGLVDTDGHINESGYLGIGFCNEDLLRDVKYLLRSVGIRSSNVQYKVQDGHSLPEHVQDQLQHEWYDFFSIKATPAPYIAEIPFNNPAFREKVNRNLDRFKDDGDRKRCRLAGLSDQLGAYKIKSIEPQEVEDVYDISVEGGQSFVADGIVVHNSNYEGARKAVWEDTLVPELKLFEVEYQHHLKMADAFVKFDLSQVPALQKDLPQIVSSAYTLYQMGVPANQALEAVGLRIGEVPNGDLPYAGAVPPGLGSGQDQGPRVDAEDDAWGMR